MQQVHGRQMSEWLRDEAHVGVDHRTSTGHVAQEVRDPGRPSDGIVDFQSGEEDEVTEEDAQNYEQDGP